MIDFTQNMGIKDESHQRAILVCVDELCQRSSSTSSGLGSGLGLGLGLGLGSGSSATAVQTMLVGGSASSSHHHRLVESSFPALERCDKCHKFLRGLLHQGLICHCNSHELLSISYSIFLNEIFNFFLNIHFFF